MRPRREADDAGAFIDGLACTSCQRGGCGCAARANGIIPMRRPHWASPKLGQRIDGVRQAVERWS
jgi:hypothetical protein